MYIESIHFVLGRLSRLFVFSHAIVSIAVRVWENKKDRSLFL